MFNGLESVANQKDKLLYKLRSDKKNRDSIYPWNNYDFDLTQYLENNYNPKKLKFSDRPYLNVFTKDLNNIPIFPKIIVEKSILKDNTIAGKSDINPNNKVAQSIKDKYNKFGEPYPGFKKEYPEYFPLTGERANNYFIKVGSCPVKSIKDKKTCINRGFTWTKNEVEIPDNLANYFKKSKTDAGSCSKPRYMHINNQVKPIMGMAGPLISIAEGIKDLNPKGLIDIFTKGEADNKEMRVLPCKETFQNYKKKIIINF